MPCWVQLSSQRDEKLVFVNLDAVDYLQAQRSGGSIVHFRGESSSTLWVEEDPEAIVTKAPIVQGS